MTLGTGKRLLMGAAGHAASDSLNIEDVFASVAYKGNGATGNWIYTGVDIDSTSTNPTKEALLIIKGRSASDEWYWIDSKRGMTKYLDSTSDNDENTNNNIMYGAASGTGFMYNCFNLGSHGGTNGNTLRYQAYVFKCAPKFFDIQTWTGSGSVPRTLSHDLNCEVGMMICKCRTTNNTKWYTYHRHVGAVDYMNLSTSGTTAQSDDPWYDTSPTDSQFTVGSDLNVLNREYVAYFFAHDPSGVIACGDGTEGTGAVGGKVDIGKTLHGWESQWVLTNSDTVNTHNWTIFDQFTNRKSFFHEITGDIVGATTNTELAFQPTGFGFGTISGSTNDFVYMAIRRGPMGVPSNGFDVYAHDTSYNSAFPDFLSTVERTGNNSLYMPVDLVFFKDLNSSSDTRIIFRQTQRKYLEPDDQLQYSDNEMDMDFVNGFGQDTTTQNYFQAHMWRRYPRVIDTVVDEGPDGATRTDTPHNLGVKPEVVFEKYATPTAGTSEWRVKTSIDAGGTYGRLLGHCNLGSQDATANTSDYTQHDTASTVRLINAQNVKFQPHMILIATYPGISKVGTYTGNEVGGFNVDCGLSSSIRFILIKNWSHTGPWIYMSSENSATSTEYSSNRGIQTNGRDSFISLFPADNEANHDKDLIDHYNNSGSHGFSMKGDAYDYGINTSGNQYFFIAFA